MLYHGDLFTVLPTLDAESIDACVTDPPYGIGFMGREWDTFKPGTGKTRRLMHPRERAAAKKIVSDNPNIHGRHRSPALSPAQIDFDYSAAGLRAFEAWTETWAREVFRVLKPGAYLVAFCAPRSYHRMACGIEDAGFVVKDKFSWLFGSGFPKSHNLGDGKGTALKPAHEPIVLAQKPFRGTIKACHAKHGTAALNIAASRVGDADTRRVKEGGRNQFPHEDDSWTPKTVVVGSNSGRWPANVILDPEAAAMLDEQTGVLVSGANPTKRNCDKTRNIYGALKGETTCIPARGLDVGGASRFYYCAKPSDEERNLGCHDLPEGNTHPTVKPVELMRWLVRLVSPPAGAVLDPFVGSGTTGMACAYELRQFVGIEREADYVAIAKRRIAACVPLFSSEASA